jgi:hypothetical protein
MMSTDPEMRECIDACTSCHQVCLQTIHHCLNKGGEHARPDHLRLMADCVQICGTSADFMLRSSPMHHLTCGACAEVCDACAADCEQMSDDDGQMRKCAQACRHCAELCHRMAGAAAH